MKLPMSIKSDVIVLIFGGIFLLGSGCASLQNLKIDPTGSCLFTRQQSGVVANTTGESSQTPSVSNPSATTLFPQPGTGTPTSTADTTSPNPFSYDRFPGGFGNVVPGSGTGAGFAGSPGYEGNYAASAPPDPVKGPALILTPKIFFAPINSEVVLVASYLGNGEYLRTNQPIEWSLDGAGAILTYDTGSWCDWAHLDFSKSQKINDRYVKTKTSANLWTIDRGTPDTKDDVEILKGQTWITLKSTKEGTSHVNVITPTIDDWTKRSANAAIHWIDAQFAFPKPTVASVGDPRPLTTIVSRSSNGSPRSGWFVEYEVIGGTAAGFGESLAQRTKVETDSSGQATVNVYQKESGAGTSSIAVRVIRPDTGEGNEGELVVGSQVIRQIWTAGGVLKIDIAGPKDPLADQDYVWKVRVENVSAKPTAATVQLRLPYGMKYVSSGANIPVPQSIQSVVQWEIDSIPGRGTYTMDVVLRADGSVVGSGRNMDIIANVFARTVGSRPTNITDSGSVPPGMTTETGSGTPTTPTGPYAPTPPSTSMTSNTSTSSGQKASGILDTPEIHAELFVGRRADNNFKKAPTPYVIQGENNWVILMVTSKQAQDISDLYFVIHPPQRDGKVVEGALEVLSRMSSTREDRGRWIRHLPKYPPRDENGQPKPDNASVLQFKPVRAEQNLVFIAEVYGNGKSFGQCQIVVSAMP